MAGINEILNIVSSFSPEGAVQPGFDDNVGLLVGSESGETPLVLVCLDATENVVAEAARLGAKLILTHHPLIFNPLNSVTDRSHVGRTVLAAVKSGIAVYSAHTNLDFCKSGINDYNAELIGMENVTAMETVGGVGVGRVGDIRPVTLWEFTRILAAKFDDRRAVYTGNGDRVLKRVAVINGGGGKVEYIAQAKALNADCYISADFAHHALIYAKENRMALVQLQHYSMEHIYIKKWTEILNSLAGQAGVKAVFAAAKSESSPTQTEDL